MGHIETLKRRGVTASFSNLNQRFFLLQINLLLYAVRHQNREKTPIETHLCTF